MGQKFVMMKTIHDVVKCHKSQEDIVPKQSPPDMLVLSSLSTKPKESHYFDCPRVDGGGCFVVQEVDISVLEAWQHQIHEG